MLQKLWRKTKRFAGWEIQFIIKQGKALFEAFVKELAELGERKEAKQHCRQVETVWEILDKKYQMFAKHVLADKYALLIYLFKSSFMYFTQDRQIIKEIIFFTCFFLSSETWHSSIFGTIKWNLHGGKTTMLYLNLSGHDIFKTRFGTSPEKHCLTATPYRLFQGNLRNLHKIGT